MSRCAFDLREAGPPDYALLPDIERDADEMFRTVGIASLSTAAEQGVYKDALLVVVAVT